jgi:hypothetical protein
VDAASAGTFETRVTPFFRIQGGFHGVFGRLQVLLSAHGRHLFAACSFSLAHAADRAGGRAPQVRGGCPAFGTWKSTKSRGQRFRALARLQAAAQAWPRS